MSPQRSKRASKLYKAAWLRIYPPKMSSTTSFGSWILWCLSFFDPANGKKSSVAELLRQGRWPDHCRCQSAQQRAGPQHRHRTGLDECRWKRRRWKSTITGMCFGTWWLVVTFPGVFFFGYPFDFAWPRYYINIFCCLLKPIQVVEVEMGRD